MKTIGIDIGTTTISAVLLDAGKREVLWVKTVPNTSAIPSEKSFERLQDPGEILALCENLLEELLAEARTGGGKTPGADQARAESGQAAGADQARAGGGKAAGADQASAGASQAAGAEATSAFGGGSKIAALGVTGQMHGILYLDAQGNPVTPLYTWQDGRGDQPFGEGETYASAARNKTGYRLASGFGSVTHFYNTVNHLIPREAVCLCTIADFVAMKFCGRRKPLLHPSMAASLGLYDGQKNNFDRQAGEALGMDMSFFGKPASTECFIGKTPQEIPVAAALGDNQASFLGAVRGSGEEASENAILLNIGTGSQISIFCEQAGEAGAGEYRPYVKGKFLWVGSPLCGGYSYHLLRRFFGETLELFGAKSEAELYQVMNQAAGELYGRLGGTPLVVDTRFRGTRDVPTLQGSAAHLTEDTLHPDHLILGFLQGIARELYELYQAFPGQKDAFRLIGSGNGLRKNPLLVKICADMFGRELILSRLPEEAACGSAFFALDLFREELVRRPIFFERNRVRRVYDGGLLFSDFFGDEKKDGKRPEEWVASTVKALNRDSGPDSTEGLSIVKDTDISLKELVSRMPEEVAGEAGELGILVKILDSGIRLPFQVHPDPAFSRKYFHSDYGKTEMWLILAVREGASIGFGFREPMTKERLGELVTRAERDRDVFEHCLNQIPVKPGDVFLIPANVVHAIGYGCLLLEVQEPTDFTIQPERWCGDYRLSDKEMYLGLKKEEALDCFDYSICGADAVALARKEPRVIRRESGLLSEELIGPKDTPCFSVLRHRISDGKLALPKGPAVYIVTEGEGVLEGENYSRPLKKGDYYLLPAGAGEGFFVTSGPGMELAECVPPGRG